jgi:hypothetical protein
MDEDKKQLNNKDVKVLRTYTSDMADAIRENEVSVIKIAMAEKEKRDKEEVYEKAKGTNFSKILLSIGGVIIIIAAIFGASYIIQKKKVVPIPPVSTVETFISYDTKSDIDVTKATNISNLSDIIKKGQQINSGTIEAFFLTRKISDIPEILTSKDFLSLIQTSMPGALIRSLSDKYLIGKYSNLKAVNANNKSAIFLIFETTDYNQTYASMLEWEGTMLSDLFILFNLPKPSNFFLGKPWNDLVVNNKDARVLYGENGEGVLYYVFINKNDFIITGNLEALKEIINRILIKNTKPL